MSFKTIRILVILAIAWAVFHFVIAPPAGIVESGLAQEHPLPSVYHASIENPPRQQGFSREPRTYALRDTQLFMTPRATFELKARVLSTHNYRTGRESRISPVDFALGWGPMARDDVLDKLKISQGNRFYFWRGAHPLPISKSEIDLHSSNMHMVAGNDSALRALRRVKPDDLVTVRGYLVDFEAGDWSWNTSTNRTDTGNGACEIVLVEEITIH